MSPPATTRPALAWGAFFTCAAIWGSTFLVIAIGNDALPPVWGAALRLALASAILFAMVRLRGQGLPRGPALRSAIYYGVLTYGVNFPLLYWGQLKVPSGLAAVLYATLPLTTPLMATAMGIERLRPIKLAGGAVALAGIMVIFGRQIGGAIGLLPLLAVFAGATIAGLATVVLRKGPRQPPVPANAVATLAGCLVCLAVSFAVGEAHPIPSSAAEILPVVYLAVLGTVVAFTLLAWLVNHWDPTNISFISVVNPVIAVTLGIAFRGERLEPSTLAGAALVLLGVLLAVASDRRDARARTRAA